MKQSLGKRFLNSRFLRLIKKFNEQLREDSVSSHAASCAFFMFLSLIPMTVLLCSIIPFTPIREEDVLAILTDNFPSTMGGFLASVVAEVYDKSAGVLSVAAITTLWSAGKGVNALITGLNVINHVENRKNGVVMRLFASLYTLFFLAGIILLLALVVYGHTAFEILLGRHPMLAGALEILIRFRSLITIAIMTIVFMVLYAVLPDHRMKIRMQIFGAFFAAVSWVIFSYFFSLYIENFNGFTMYGSLTTIVVLLFWLYSCMYLVFIGANINKYLLPIVMIFDHRRKERSELKGQRESLED
jgi:membrane protein